MPAYSNTQTPNSIARGDVQSVWVAGDGNLVSGTKTQRVAICQNPGGGPQKVSMAVIFSGAPGAISLQPQTSDTDVDNDFQAEGAAITTLGLNNEVRAEFTTVAAKFVRLLAGTVTNAVTATVNFGA